MTVNQFTIPNRSTLTSHKAKQSLFQRRMEKSKLLATMSTPKTNIAKQQTNKLLEAVVVNRFSCKQIENETNNAIAKEQSKLLLNDEDTSAETWTEDDFDSATTASSNFSTDESFCETPLDQ